MFKLVNGERIPLTKEELRELEANQVKWNQEEGQRMLHTILEKRRVAYGSLESQLDLIFHEGLDVWRTQIQMIKDTYPKPEVE